MTESEHLHTLLYPVEPAAIGEAADLLMLGRLVAFPTETVYGLGGDATNDRTVAAIFAAKGRPSFNPLIIHVADRDHADSLVVVDKRARRLMDRFWPGPLTLVLPRQGQSPISLLASAGLDSLAIRLPGHGAARQLIAQSGKPIAAPSANRSGSVSPTQASHVMDSLGGRIDLILDGGPCSVGVESTVLDLTGDQPGLLRPGGITAEEIEDLLGTTLLRPGADPTAPKSPGMLASHYAPGLPVRLDAAAPSEGEAFLAFGPHDGATLQLSASGDLGEAAANLFSMLRALDRAPFTGIAIAPIPGHGLGLAINDRLRRAAAPRLSPLDIPVP